jgi:integrase
MPSSPEQKQSTRKRRGRGEGALYRRADGEWCAAISAGYDAAGKRRRRVVYGATKKEVQDKLKDEHQTGFVETGRVTVAGFLCQWLESTVKPSVAPTTHLRYEQTVRLHIVPHLGSLRLRKLAPVHIAGMYDAQRKAGASARHQQMAGLVLQKALKHAVRLRLLAHNPCVDIDKPRPQRREMRVWDRDQANEFLTAAKSDRLYALYVLAITTGMRQGELFGLEWSDIDFDGAVVVVNRTLEEIRGMFRTKEPKTAKGRRRIDLPKIALDALHDHRKAMLAEGYLSGPVFCDRNGGYLRKSNVVRRSFQGTIAKAHKAANEKAAKVKSDAVLLPAIRFHDLRHTAATLLLLAGENVKVVSERLGHATIMITLDTYAHVLPTMQKAAAARLDKLFG